jgi:hypothetical protein
MDWRLAVALHARYVKNLIYLAADSNSYFSILQAKKAISYAESSDDEDAFDPADVSTKKRAMRVKRSVDDDDEEDVFVAGLDGAADDDGEDWEHF